MSFFRKKPRDIKVPTGRDNVNFRKILFLPIADTKDLITNEEWERLDFRCLTMMKTKMLRASCIARSLERRGGKRTLVQRLTASLVEQKNAEFLRRKEEAEEYERQMDMLGGVWSFGSGFAGQLGHGDRNSNGTPRLIKKLRGRGVSQVYAGYDSDVAFCVTRNGDVYVWGKRSGPTGLSRHASLQKLYQKTYEGVDWSSDDEAEENKKEQQKQKSQVKSKKQELEVAENHQAQLKHFEDSEDEEDDHEEEAAQEEEEQEEDALDHEQDILDPVKLFSLCGEGINHIAVGRYHCCAKTKDGDVYTWGQNDHAQLGLESVHILSEALSKKARVRYGSDQFEPVLWQRSVGETVIITSVDVGTSHTVAVTSKAEVVAFGAVFNTTENSTLSRCLGKLSVAQVSCGALHAGLVTTNGQAYTWGSGDGGRLGHGDNTSYVNPRLVEALKEDIVFEISCACWHTVAIILVPPLLKGGLVYTWGSGRLGQLAQGDKQISSSPGLVTDLLTTHVLVKKICTGMYHTVVLSVDDEVLTWGSNQNGCLGRPEELHGLEENFCAVPGQVEGLQNFVGRPCGIAAGREFTLIVTKPYLGMSQSELDQKKQEQEAVKNSISNQRKQLILEKKEKLLEIQNEKQKWIIQQLNLLYPKCSLCKHGLVCPGFQKNQANPAICLHCMHERKQHDDLHLVTTSTLSYLLQVIDKLKIEMDFSKIKEIEFENLLEKEIETLIEEEQEQEQEQEQE